MKYNLIVTFCGMRLQCLQRWREWTWQAWMAVICFVQGTHAFVNWSEPSLQKWALNEKEGYLTRHGMHFKKGIYRLILPIRWILEKAKPDPLAYSMAPSPHGVHSGRSVSLAMLILPGSSDKLGQAWASAQLKGWKSRDMEKVSFRHDRWRMLTDVDGNSLLQFFSWGSHPHSKTLAEWEWHLLELSKMSISYHVMLLRDGDRVQFPQPQTVPVSCLDVLCLEATWQNIFVGRFSVSKLKPMYGASS